MNHEFDVVVIGTGSAGGTAAFTCKEAGLSVAIVDKREYGGTCALRGCDPKKVLVSAVEVVERAERMKGLGVTGGTRIDWSELMAFKRTFTDPVPVQREKSYRDKGIVTFHGTASFSGADSLTVGDDSLRFRHAVIGSGALPAPLNIEGAEHVMTSEGFLNLERLPERIVFIGGGYISFEFAHVARRAGAQVTILQHGPRPLAGFEPALVDRLVQAGAEIGIEVRVNSDVVAVKEIGSGFEVEYTANGTSQNVAADLVIHGAGRTPDVAGLKLDRANIKVDGNAIAVNEYLQTGNPAVYAAGDCVRAGGMPLTPVAGLEGEIAGKNIVAGNTTVPDFGGLASIVYTLPSLASVGLTEDQAKKMESSSRRTQPTRRPGIHRVIRMRLQRVIKFCLTTKMPWWERIFWVRTLKSSRTCFHLACARRFPPA